MSRYPENEDGSQDGDYSEERDDMRRSGGASDRLRRKSAGETMADEDKGFHQVEVSPDDEPWKMMVGDVGSPVETVSRIIPPPPDFESAPPGPVTVISAKARSLIKAPPQGSMRLGVEGMPRVVVVLARDTTLVIGRDPGHCDVLVEDKQVSRRHCSVTQSGDAVLVQDMGSRNGTRINDTHIRGSAAASPGDKIRIGRTAFIIEE